MNHNIEDIKQIVNELRNRLIGYRQMGEIASDRLIGTKRQIEKSKREQITINEKILQTQLRYNSLRNT